MALLDTNPPPICPDCGATLEGDFAACTHCGWRRLGKTNAPATQTEAGATPNPYQAPQAEQIAARTFGLGSLMLVMTLIAVLLGVAMVHPGLALLLVFVAAVALARTMGIVYRRKLAGGPTAGGDKVIVFLGSLFVAIVCSIASGVAFYATCWVGVGAGMAFSSLSGGAGDYGPMIVGMLAGGAVGLGLAILVFYWLAKRSN